MFQQGDIVVVPFPFTDLSSSKLRPAIIISNAERLMNTGDVIVVMLTTKVKQEGVNIPMELKDADIVLPQNSFVRCHRIATIDESIIQKKIGEIKSEFLVKILAAINNLISAKVK